MEPNPPEINDFMMPTIWERLIVGARIIDLVSHQHIKGTIMIFEEELVSHEPLAQSLNLYRNEPAKDELVSLLSTWLGDTNSLLALRGETGDIIGALIGRIIKKDPSQPEEPEEEKKTGRKKGKAREKSDAASKRSVTTLASPTSKTGTLKKNKKNAKKSVQELSEQEAANSSVYTMITEVEVLPPPPLKIITMFDDEEVIFQDEDLQKIQAIHQKMLHEYDVFETFSISKYYRIYAIIVETAYKNLGIGKALMRTCIEMAQINGVKVILGNFTSYAAQNLVHKFGFVKEVEVLYKNWTKEDEAIFKTSGDNKSIALMVYRVPELYVDKKSKKK